MCTIIGRRYKRQITNKRSSVYGQGGPAYEGANAQFKKGGRSFLRYGTTVDWHVPGVSNR